MIAAGKGVLQCQVNDRYDVRITLAFRTNNAAVGALSVLGGRWKQDGKALTWLGGGYEVGEGDAPDYNDESALDVLKAELDQPAIRITYLVCTKAGCATCKGLDEGSPEYLDDAHSSHKRGFGPDFEIEIECDDPQQEKLNFHGRYGR